MCLAWILVGKILIVHKALKRDNNWSMSIWWNINYVSHAPCESSGVDKISNKTEGTQMGFQFLDVYENNSPSIDEQIFHFKLGSYFQTGNNLSNEKDRLPR